MRVRMLLFAILGLGFWTACVTPVIPMPPPDPSLMEFSQLDPTKGEVVLSGDPGATQGGTLVHLYHPASGKGQIIQAEQDGSFISDPIQAAEGDQLEVWSARFVAENEPSSVVCILVRYQGMPVKRCDE